MSKRQKVEVLGKDSNILVNRSSEVEDILSGKVLDTDIPGLEELMSTESMYHFNSTIIIPLLSIEVFVVLFYVTY